MLVCIHERIYVVVYIHIYIYIYIYTHTLICIQVFTQTPATNHAGTPCLDSMSDTDKWYTEQANTCPVYCLVSAPSPPSSRHVSTASFRKHMMMIAVITIKSSLVPLIEGLCAQIYFRFEISVVCSHLLLFNFCERKNMLKENKKAVSPDFYL